MYFKNIKKLAVLLSLILGLVSCVQVAKTIQYDESISYTEIDGYKYHSEVFGGKNLPVIIVVHGGPGGDFEYLKSLRALSENYRVVFYDQRGNGLSPRVSSDELTLEKNLDDLHSITQHFSAGEKVKLIGHSWGGMLVAGYLSSHPENVSQAVIIEPGMLYQEAAIAFIEEIKKTQSIFDALALIRYISVYPFVSKTDGHEGFDYVMTKLLNRSKPGAPYQCEGEVMPEGSFKRGGYQAFNNMLKPVMDDPSSFTYDLTAGISQYTGDLMMISSECSTFGYNFQQKYHMAKLPVQTRHIKAEKMGHNMLTLNPQWSLAVLNDFLK